MIRTNRQARILGVLGAMMALGLCACVGKFYFKGKGKFVGLEGSVEFGYSNNAIKAEELPDETRVDMEFLDEAGNPVPPGAQGVGEGDEVPTPDGAVVAVITGPSSVQTGCVGCTSAPQAPAQAGLYYQDRWIHVETIVPDLAGTNVFGNVLFHAVVRVPLDYGTLDVYELVRPILLAGAGSVVPNDPAGISVDVQLFLRTTVDPLSASAGQGGGGGGFPAAVHAARLGGLEIEVMDVTASFTSFDLFVNGHHVADDGILATSSHGTASNGWRFVKLDVPEVLLDYSSSHANVGMDLAVSTAEDAVTQVVKRSLEAWQ